MMMQDLVGRERHVPAAVPAGEQALLMQVEDDAGNAVGSSQEVPENDTARLAHEATAGRLFRVCQSLMINFPLTCPPWLSS
jgi:hypothetical protein